MVQRRSPKCDRQLIAIGANITCWRRLQGLSASALAERAYVTLATLRGIEQGTGTASFQAVLAVLGALGVADSLVKATDPLESPVGRALVDEQIAGA